MGLKFLDAQAAGLGRRHQRDRVRHPGQAAFRPPAPTSASSRTAGAAAASRRRCSMRSTRRTPTTCCLSRPPATPNNNVTTANYPSNYTAPNVMTVAATDNPDSAILLLQLRGLIRRSWGARYGYRFDRSKRGLATFSGTSMAAPHVSGAAALVLSSCSSEHRPP